PTASDKAAAKTNDARVILMVLSKRRFSVCRARTEGRALGKCAIVLGADEFLEGLAAAYRPERGETLPRHREGALVLHRHDDFEPLAQRIAVRAIALDDMDLVGVRCAEGIDHRHLVRLLPDRIDDERVAFVMADGLAVPGALR